MSVPAAGGSARELIPVDSASGETGHRWPVTLADGSVFYTRWKGDVASARIAVTSVDGDRPASLDVHGSSPLTVADGWLVYAGAHGQVLEAGELHGFLRAIHYDRGARRVEGEPVELVADVLVSSGGAIKGALSLTKIMYLSGASSQRVLLLSDSLGRSAPLMSSAARYRAPRFSPDGRKIAYVIVSDSGADIWTYDVVSRLRSKLTTDGWNGRPAWTPDGERLVFLHETELGGAALWWQRADGSGSAELLLGPEHGNPFEGIITGSRNGRALVYRTDMETTGNGNIMYRLLDGDTASHPVAATEFIEVSPTISRDGRWVAYSSNRSGAREIYVQGFPGPGPAHPISNGGGTEPIWAPDGKRLYYRLGDDFVEATIRTFPAFAVVARRTVMSRPAENNFAHANYDVSASIQFVIVASPAEPDFFVIHNWAEELRERLKAAK